jgi:hypothetical protein
LGAAILLIAYSTMGPAHTAFTFVLVVLGVAILLYGTGTQGMGSLDSTSGAGKYRVAIAGGAGVLAFCVALGIIHYSNQMKGAFQVQKKYVRVQFGPGDPSSDLSQFLAHFSIDGLSVPSFRHGKVFEVLVPYLGTDLVIDKRLDKADLLNRPQGSNPLDCGATAATSPVDGERTVETSAMRQNIGQLRENNRSLIKTVAVDFFPIGRKQNDPVLGEIPTRYFYVRINDANFTSGDGAHDFEKYSELMCVSLASKEVTDAQLGKFGTRSESAAPGSEQIHDALPPVPVVRQR